ncbi:MAG: hypothetical protein C0597_00105 [Marinilabiliales bacterium]|nr:MAG: hypothetical protein C0597_00105 [Marinilabiliales bacterium]
MEFVLKNKKSFAFIFWFWVALILYFTLTPGSLYQKFAMKDQNLRMDYILHFLIYFGLSILYMLWKADNFLLVKNKFLVYFLVSALILSGISEYAQTFIPGRSFNPIDYYLNALGIILGVACPKAFLIKSL